VILPPFCQTCQRTKTGVFINKFVAVSIKITDGRLLNHITNKEIIVKAMPTKKMLGILKKLNAPH
jgi:hypothetical protein